MKNLTHYFQSPEKVLKSPVSVEDCDAVTKPPQHSDLTDPCDSVSSTQNCNKNNTGGKITCHYGSAKVSSDCKDTTDGSSSDQSECLLICHNEKPSKSRENLKRRPKNGLKSKYNKNVGVDVVDNLEHSVLNSQVSPNAFHVIMSTQQIFGSSNCGQKEHIGEMSEANSKKQENKKRIKENLEKMSKRKLEMETNLHAYENKEVKPKKKRQRIVVNSDSEEELLTINVENSLDIGAGEVINTKKRKKPELEVNVNSKRKKNVKLPTDESKKCAELGETMQLRKKTSTVKCKSQELNSEACVKKNQFDKVKPLVSKQINEDCFDQNDSEDIGGEPMEGNTNFECVPVVLNTENCLNSEESKTMHPSDDVSKKKSNILNYFNKVPNAEKMGKSDKIEVTADVHFPVILTGNVSKKMVMKKSKKKGKPETEDDIQVIDTEMIENPTSKTDTVRSVLEVKHEMSKLDETHELGSQRRIGGDSSIPQLAASPRCKDWKLRIRMSDSSLPYSPSPVKQKKKDVTPLKKRKLKLKQSNEDKKSALLKEASAESEDNALVNKVDCVSSSETRKNLRVKEMNVKNEPSPSSCRKKKISAVKIEAKETVTNVQRDSVFELEVEKNRKKAEPMKELPVLETQESPLELHDAIPKKQQSGKRNDNSKANEGILSSGTSRKSNISNVLHFSKKNPKVDKEDSSERSNISSCEKTQESVTSGIFNYNGSSRLRSSPRLKSVISIPVYGISSEDESFDDFDSDSDDDFCGDEDDFGDDSDCDIFENDSDSEPIFEAISKKKQNVTTSNNVVLDQKIVLQFLKKAKGTLIRKMALNDPANKEPCITDKKSAPVKLAPVFMTLKGKKPDKATLLARKTFLQSGVPEAVKKMVEIQKLTEEQDHAMFPSISHIQQKDESASIWNLSNALHKYRSITDDSSFDTSLNIPIENFIKYNTENESNVVYSASPPPKINLFRGFLQAIKAESPDFPVYRTFRQLYALSQSQHIDSAKNVAVKKGRRRSSIASKSKSRVDSESSENVCHLWNMKYRPCSSSNIFGNGKSVNRLKKWLQLWMEVKENTFQKKNIEDVSSGDEFLQDASDEESGRTVLPKKIAILVGPNGSGKTMTVYALAHELGYKVLEINAATKRTGRRILSELLEATQSHQVNGQGNETNTPGIKSFCISKRNSDSTRKKENEPQTSKLSLILVEDVDVVFEEEDEGFLSALSTLVVRTKRPFILVTSDPSCPHLSRFMENSLLLEFQFPPTKHIGVWLQLVSLLEGVRVRRSCVEELLNFNKGDVRKTLLHLQFWVLSGGDNPKSPVEMPCELTDFPDDISNSSWVSVDDKNAENETNHPYHSNFLRTFLATDPQILLLDRGKVWWHTPELAGLKYVSCKSVKCVKGNGKKDAISNECDISHLETATGEKMEPLNDIKITAKKWENVCPSKDLTAIVTLMDTLSVVENLSHFTDSVVNEPDQCSWEKDPVDSLSLSPDMRASEYGSKETAKKIKNWLVCTSLSHCSSLLCADKMTPQFMVLQQPLPKEKLNLRADHHSISRQLENAVAMSYWPQRRAVAMDYISSLRSISRLEQERICINDKRNNRFFHYLKGLGVQTNLEVLSAACNAFGSHGCLC